MFSIGRPINTSDRRTCQRMAHSVRSVPVTISPRGCLVLITVTALFSVFLAAPVDSATAAEPPIRLDVTGPVINSDAPDPSILAAGRYYFAFTTNAGGNNVPVYLSTDLSHWSLLGDAMPVLATWASPGFSWSPSVTASPGGGYQLFYDAFDQAEGGQCIGRAVAPSPAGPFVDSSSTPFFCQPSLGGSIDASVYHQHSGDVLVWKSDRDAGIWSQALTAGDGGLTGSPHLLLSPTASWEHGVIEGPAMVRIGSTLTLWFSAGAWSGSSYSIGIVTCDSPLGPCDAGSASQVLHTSATLHGPGGPAFFSKRGTLVLAFSAWVGSGRSMYLATL